MRTSVRGAGLLRAALLLSLVASLASAQSVTTTFASNNGLAGNMFDMSTFGAPILINDFDVNLDAGSWTVDVWAVTAGTSFVPVHTAAASWTLLGSATVTSAGLNLPTNLGLSLSYLMAPNATTGFYITGTSGSPINYTNGVNGGGIYAQDSFLAIREGIGKGLVTGYPTTFSTTVGGGTLPPSTSSRIANITCYYVPASSNLDDIGCYSLSAPSSSTACNFLSTTEAVITTVFNIGMNSVPAGNNIQLDLFVDGIFQTSEFPAHGLLNLGDSVVHTFAATANLAAPGSHTVDVVATLLSALDQDLTNNTGTKVVNSGNPLTVTSFPWTENFDSVTINNGTVPPSGWVQDTADATGTNSDWVFRTGTTVTVNTGPNGDHTSGTGYYAYTEDAGNFTQINLLSPCLDLLTLANPVLTFWMHSHNNTVPPTNFQNFLSVDVVAYPGGAVTLDVGGPYGDQGAPNWASSAWMQQSVGLGAFAGQLIQLRFRGQSSGGGANHDIGLDDVSIFQPVATPGQAPRPGLGVFDINNSLNGNTLGVGSGANGPYFSGVAQGATMLMSFNGEPSQAIAVVYGPLNPVSATYPGGIGQFDIGGPGVDPQGIPLNIGVFVNAIGWAQGGFIGFPLDALFFTDAAGDCAVGFSFPNFGIPGGSVLTTFQSAITSSAAPFVYLTNAVELTVN